MTEKLLYFDHNATTPLAPEVLEEMLPFLRESYGNPSSLHRLGQEASRALQLARERLSAFLHAQPEEIIFTSGGTESNHLAFFSALGTTGRTQFVTTQVEHASVYRLCQFLQRKGYQVHYVGVNKHGQPNWEEFERYISSRSALVSVAWANSETGVLSPIEMIGELCRSQGVLFHCDAVQVAGKLPIEWSQLPMDFLSLSAHKFHGPKGVGALLVRKGVPVEPLFFGGGQEQGRRSGTENVAGIVGMGKAAELASQYLAENGPAKLAELRNWFEDKLLAEIPGVRVVGQGSPRIPNTTSLFVPGTEAYTLVHELSHRGICVSTGSACSSRSVEPSRVLRAMGFSAREARATLRISLSRYTTREELCVLTEILPSLVEEVRRAFSVDSS
ncbi:cysteine desulfurase family protein [Candidatus Methylacidithermus pantelleriae]|uniref:Cysteine desulfurase n=1 Tax=Candidatus Methylacidithermus pantelleriae TaxID=2744239 RepID=A0A8J2BS23_9BACT|nr:cysteine desulfurase family protein [Candidatus Methylacidithermus pantelleriae]CAF0693961.1 Cysteine desulfurase [Candidatus Methylacidithermus pantelleriae]